MDGPTLRAVRFRMILQDRSTLGKDVIAEISEYFMQTCPTRPNTMEGTFEVLEYLSARYVLHIVTNGFQKTQQTKLKASDLTKYFRTVTTSECARAKKPDPEFFEFALDRAECSPKETLIVGDNFKADIIGAGKAGIDQAYFAPAMNGSDFKPTYHIQSLKELMSFL
jgi:putative hydrolase of the HAD superfamily